MAKTLPFFSHYSQEIEMCLRRASCQGLGDLINTPGIVEKVIYYHCLGLSDQALMKMLQKLASTLLI